MQAKDAMWCAVLAGLATVAVQAQLVQAQVAHKDTFPKIAGLHMGGDFADPGLRTHVAKLDVAIVGMWRNYSGGGLTYAQVVADIRSKANAAGNTGLILSKYTNISESVSTEGTADDDIWLKLTSERGPGGPATDWWARNSGSLNVSQWPSYWTTNITRFVTPDKNGDRFTQWRAKRDYDNFFRASPAVNGWFLDNWFWQPRVDADWNGDGINDDNSDPTGNVQRWYRQGIADWLDQVTKLAPNHLVIGNVDGQFWTNDGMLTEPEFKGRIGGALMEGAIGYDWSPEKNSTWANMMLYYRTLLANTKAPHVVIVAVVGAPNDYKTLRYGLASVLMDDGYLAFNSSAAHKEYYWFDEFDLAGQAGTDWLGKSLSPPQMSPWSNGVYRRDFENGIVLINPKGNGTRTVTVEPGFARIKGIQDPGVNNGQKASSVTLSERDGILLVRETRVARPKPPGLSVQ